MTQLHSIRCVACGTVFTCRTSQGRYCSVECRTAYQRAKYAAPPREVELTKPTAGAISELVVCVDLLSAGYEVFRAVSASCGCDMVVCKDGRSLRVEVRSAVVSQSGRLGGNVHDRDRGRIDVYALVARDNTIAYYPALIPERVGSERLVSEGFAARADHALAA